MTPEPLDKPGKMLPCNGCGLCCQEEVCDVGQEIFANPDKGIWLDKGPCPGLVIRKGLYRCGLVLMEASVPIEKKLAEALGIGRGCCADDVPDIIYL
jgi:hypothetical protein